MNHNQEISMLKQMFNCSLVRRSGICILLIGIFFLSGCATMKKEECLTADWYQIGYEDGSYGRAANRFSQHRKACSKYDVTPDLQEYLRGRDEGLHEFCTPRNGYLMGLKGRVYTNLCPRNMAPAFLEAYNKGIEVYNFKQNLKDEQKNIQWFKNKLEDLEKEIQVKENELSKNCSDSQACKRILDEIRDLDEEKKAIEHELFQKENQVHGMKQTLSEMEAQNRFY